MKLIGSFCFTANRVEFNRHVSFVNTLAAICNSVSLRYLVPAPACRQAPGEPGDGIGGHAIDVMASDGELHLAFAHGDENFTPFGTDSLEHSDPGEIIFTYNMATVLCRRWTSRPGEFSKLQRTTTAVVINVDGLPPPAHAPRSK